MYTRLTRSESWLVVVEMVIFIDKIIDTVKDQFFKDFRTNRQERHWTIVIYYLLKSFFVCVCTGIILPFFQLTGKTPCWRQFLDVIDRGLIIDKLNNFTIHIEIPSWPWALCGFNPLINFEMFPQSISKSLSLFCV